MIAKRKIAVTRRGLTLVEVLAALAIFLMAMIVIGQIITLSSERAREAVLRGEAARKAESKLAEVIWGAVPLSPEADVPFEDDPSWTWSLECEQGNITGLWDVTVRVRLERGGLVLTDCALSRKVLDPAQRGTNMDAGAASGSESTEEAPSSDQGGNTSGNNAAQAPAAPASGGTGGGQAGGGGQTGGGQGGNRGGGGQTGGGQGGNRGGGGQTGGGQGGNRGGGPR